jgi:hypothetical protein
MKTSRLFLSLLLLLFSIGAGAGSAPESNSKVPGVLLGFLSEDGDAATAYFGAGHSQSYIDGFRAACSKKRRIWAHSSSSEVVCTKLAYIEEGGNGPVYELKLNPIDKRRTKNQTVVFSLNPLKNYTPDVRTLDSEEVAKLLSVYKSETLNLAIKKAIDSGEYKILDLKNKSLSIYIFKWKHVKDSEYSSNDYFLVINRDADRYFSAGNFHGKMLGFVDIDNDEIPEVQVSIGCDGTCEQVNSIYKNTRQLVSISVH